MSEVKDGRVASQPDYSAEPKLARDLGPSGEYSSRGPLDDADIAALSAAASGGPWTRCGERRGGCSCGYIFSHGGESYVVKALTLDDDVDPVATKDLAKANAAFIVALVNAYRSGRLVVAASATEAGTAETRSGSVHEGATRRGTP